MNTKQIKRKLPLILGVVSVTLLAPLQPLGAMDKVDDRNEKSASKKHDGLATQIHAKVKEILENFHRNMEEYYERTRVKKNPVIKVEPEVKTIKNQPQQQGDIEALEEAYEHWSEMIASVNFVQKNDLTEEEKLSIYGDNAKDAAIVPQQLHYTDEKNYQTRFITCLTIGDGDCFFYAAFTEKGENTGKVAKKAAEMRKKLLTELENDQIVNSLRFMMFEQYMHLLIDNDNHPDVPRSIKKIYLALYNLFYKNKGEGDVEYDKIMKLINDKISPNDIKKYMEPLRIVSIKEESYIPLSEFPHVVEPASLLAQWGRKQIRIFRINTTNGNLDLLKTVGNENDPIVNILHSGKHFTRLYAYKREWDECAQIFQNYFKYTYE